MSIEVFVSDLDGTLLNGERKVAPYSAEIINKALLCGYKFAVATGRSWYSASPLLKEAGIDCDFILLNGAEYRKSDGTPVEQHFLRSEDATALLNLLDECKMDYEINGSQGDYVGARSYFPNPNILNRACDFLHLQARVLKIFAYSFEPEKLENFRKRLSPFKEVTLTSSSPWNVEITAKNITKATMLSKFLAINGLTPEQCLIFGDGDNDTELFKTFPHTCAMGNALPAIKALAEQVVATNEEYGVAETVKSYLQAAGYAQRL